MSEWAPKVFWSEVRVSEEGGGYAVLLDGRVICTPAKAQFIVPTKPLADAIAREWRRQDTHIDPISMPFTRMANAAIDKLSVQHKEVCEMLASYGDSDLLCYRADSPKELVDRQSAAWDPLLEWCAKNLGARLQPRVGVMPRPQSEADLSRLSALVHELNSYELSGFHDLVVISGSLVIGFAVLRGHIEAETAFKTSRIDESFQQELWGVDDEAAAQEAVKKAEFLTAEAFLMMVRSANSAPMIKK